MKKISIFTLMILLSMTIKAQTINIDTLAKYSKKEEQVKVFDKIAADLKLDSSQKAKFDQTSTTYFDKLITVVSKKDAGRMEILKALKSTGQAYMDKLKTFLSPAQLELMKQEREKYQFGRRFLAAK